ncbi:nitrogen regulation protein NR(II) [Granulicella cerasi]|uniref:histidine kinase n=2 Tax=Granulicella cerasi TaxID=741063 RepID=A0ABW1Z6H0_9BACT
MRDGFRGLDLDPRPIDDLEAANAAWRTGVAEPIVAAVRRGEYTSDPGVNLREKGHIDALRAETRGILTSQRGIRDAAVAEFHSNVRHAIEAGIALAAVLGIMVGVFSFGKLQAISYAFQQTFREVNDKAHLASEAEQRLRAILTSIGDAVIVCDNEGRVEMLNTVAQILTGYSQQNALHRPIAEVLPLVDETTRESLDPSRLFDRAIHTGNQLHALLEPQDRATPQEVVVDLSASPIFDTDRKRTGSVIVFRDITEQLQTRHALLASEKLAVAGRLAATIAHEIHNPLDAVINILYLLRNHPDADDQNSLLDLASGELDRVAQISRAMLGMYRESKTPVAVNLTDLLESLLLLLDRHFMQASITVQKELLPDAIITGYPAELRQVFTNLLTNALDASSSGSTLTVSMHRSVHPTGITVVVHDHGVGIDAETLPHLFQPFFTTKGEKGTGLGLWVSQGIVQKHGGSISVESSTEASTHGTTLTVTLPRGNAPFIAAERN